MIEFTDSRGARWLVYEVQRQPRGEQRRDPLPTEFQGGWLVFEHAEGKHRKRRLAQFPERWRELPPPELEELCRSAARARKPAGGAAATLDQRIRQALDGRR
ncbi:MAG TPA: hypothetical protein VKA84_03555 [Gemmatimonadaceae bacterium]|nr:hypothetical protein [Gemmatimonadaceae bacterium]